MSGKPGFFLHVIIMLGHRGNESGETVHHFLNKQSSAGLFSFYLFITKLLNMSLKRGTSHIVESMDVKMSGYRSLTFPVSLDVSKFSVEFLHHSDL